MMPWSCLTEKGLEESGVNETKQIDQTKKGTKGRGGRDVTTTNYLPVIIPLFAGDDDKRLLARLPRPLRLLCANRGHVSPPAPSTLETERPDGNTADSIPGGRVLCRFLESHTIR